MDVIILAAGRGSRLAPLTDEIPKALLEFSDGTCALKRQLDILSKFNEVDDIIIVIGYEFEKIEDAITKWGYEELVETVYNPFVDNSDNLISLWLAIQRTDSDYLITNGDNIFNYELIHTMISNFDNGVNLGIDFKKDYDRDDMKVTLQKGNIKNISKEINITNTDAESIGIAIVSGKEPTKKFEMHLKEIVRSDDNKNYYWLEALNEMANDVGVDYIEVHEQNWHELDFKKDLEEINSLINRNIL